jgi:hypothetical protein
MARIIAFFNQKGGTAKTTSTLNVARPSANAGKRVLALDMDPQASLTMATGVDISSLPLSVYDLLVDEDLSPIDVAVPTAIPGLDLVPSHPDLAAAELELLNISSASGSSTTGCGMPTSHGTTTCSSIRRRRSISCRSTSSSQPASSSSRSNRTRSHSWSCDAFRDRRQSPAIESCSPGPWVPADKGAPLVPPRRPTCWLP